MTGERHVLLAAKQAPVSHDRDPATGRPRPAMSVGGTGSVVADIAARLGVSAFGSAVTDDDRALAVAHPDGLVLDRADGRSVRVRYVSHDPEVVTPQRYVDATELLWNTLHGMWDRWRQPSHGDRTDLAWQAVTALNRDFAAALAAAVDDRTHGVLVHDYQLCLAPAILRDRHPRVPVLLFIHIAWPGAESWSTLPRRIRQDVLHGMCAADVVGFFARPWAREFLRCVQDTLPDHDVDPVAGTIRAGGRTCRVRVMPLSMSGPAVAGHTGGGRPDVEEWIGDAPLVVHSGRTDPIKNAPRAIEAFVGMRRRHPELAPAKLLVRLTPHRLAVPVNRDYHEATLRAAELAEQTLGAGSVRVVCDNDRAFTLASLRRADVVVLNSVVDGQNLTAFEAGVVNERDAPLVLSETCGAADVLAPGSLVVSPFDLHGQIEALATALRAPADERARMARLRRGIAARHELSDWVGAQLAALDEVDTRAPATATGHPPAGRA